MYGINGFSCFRYYVFVDGVVVVVEVEVFAVVVVEVVSGCELLPPVCGTCVNVTRNPTLGSVAPDRENMESISELRSRDMLWRHAFEFPPFKRLVNGSWCCQNGA